jgi:ribonuclease HII
MIAPTFDKEIKLRKNGYKFIAGIDEVGRGPLAGPVVACAVVILLNEFKNKLSANCHPEFILESINFTKQNNNKILKQVQNDKINNCKNFKGIRDSKQLSERQREKFYKILTHHSQICYGVGIVSEKIIDKINILQAALLAMKKAVENLKVKPDFLLIDGKWTLENYPISQTAIPQGDKKIFSIAAASIIAKVTRDRMLVKLRQKYPQYGFEKHKGYGTKLHLKMLKKYGPCEIHRRSFKPIKNNF